MRRASLCRSRLDRRGTDREDEQISPATNLLSAVARCIEPADISQKALTDAKCLAWFSHLSAAAKSGCPAGGRSLLPQVAFSALMMSGT